MFDIGFPELLLLSVIALVVLGPKRLPHAMRTAGRWYNQVRYAAGRLKRELEDELQVDENNALRQQSISGYETLRSDVQSVVNETTSAIKQSTQQD